MPWTKKGPVQGLPLERNAWASGDGHGEGTMEGIHIEICWSKSGGERFEKAERNAAELIAQLLKQYGWGIDKVTKHQDYDGKYCPHRTLDLGWQRFLNMIQQEMEEEAVTYEQWKEYQEKYEKEQAAKAQKERENRKEIAQQEYLKQQYAGQQRLHNFLTSDGQERQQPVYTNTSVKMPFTVYDSLLDLFGGGLDQ